MRLVQARIVTANVPRLARFYEGLLGTAAPGSDEYVELQVQGARLAISSQCAMEVCGAIRDGHVVNHSVVLEFQVADVDAEHRRLAGSIPRFVLAPATQPWGERSMLFRDPDGNLISFFSHPEASDAG
jgi:uncharacterized glyoxalase superfamily protein PhnB